MNPSLKQINRKLPEDGNYSIGPYNMTRNQVDNMIRGGASREQVFTFSLEDTNAVDTAYADGDVLVELGEIDVADLLTKQAGDYAATRILIKAVHVNVLTAAGETLAATLKVSATSGTATNAAASSPTEIVGAGAVYKDENGDNLSITEADLDLDSVDLLSVKPGIDVAIETNNLYLCATTAINADITAGRGVVVVEYSVL